MELEKMTLEELWQVAWFDEDDARADAAMALWFERVKEMRRSK